MTEPRRVRHVHRPNVHGTLLAEHGNMVWVYADNQSDPLTYDRSTWEDLPPDPPKVGELWSHKPYYGSGYVCVAVSDDSWSFVQEDRIPKSFEDATTEDNYGVSLGGEKCAHVKFWTRRLPETSMTKVEKN